MPSRFPVLPQAFLCQSIYLQMKLLNDARDQPGELVDINGIDESYSFFNAVGEEEDKYTDKRLSR